LIDGVSGGHLWTQRYDRRLEDIFAVQDDVTQSIVAVLPGRVEAAALERASRKISNSLDAYDYLLRGKYCHHLESPEASREAEAHFNRSTELDPRFASAYAWKACTLGQAWSQEFRPRTPELWRQIVEIVEHAASLDANDAECHRIMCRIALMHAQFAKSDHHLERALALNPNDPRLVVQRGINLTFSGEPDAAIPWIERAVRLDPFSAHRYYLDTVRALFMAHRPAEAITVLERSSREHWEHYLWLAACYAVANEQAAAQQARVVATSLRPQLSIGSYSQGRSNGNGPRTRRGFATRWRGWACRHKQISCSCLAESTAKPDEVSNRIERLARGPYLEIFSRQSRAGWDAWGAAGSVRTRNRPSHMGSTELSVSEFDRRSPSGVRRTQTKRSASTLRTSRASDRCPLYQAHR
jgi:hypothetical protein